MTIRWPRFHPAWRGRNPHVIPNVAERSEESKDSCLQNQVRGCQADALDSSAALRVVAGVNRPDVEIAGPKTCRTIVLCSYVLLPCWPTHQTGEGGESMTVQTLRSACPRCRGYMYTNQDQYGQYRECLHCGHMVDLRRPAKRKAGEGRSAA